MSDYQTELSQQLSAMELSLTAQQQSSLIKYLELLIKWNKAFNLTSVRDPLEMISRHLADSLSVLPYVRTDKAQAQRLIDVGSGPGLPGIPLAICLPELDVTTLDSNGKKTRFQQQVKMELGLANLTVVNSRVESHQPEPFDLVISRAFASIKDMLEWTQHLCKDQGIFLAMKGLYPEEELQAVDPQFVLEASHRLFVPKCDAERHLLILRRA